MVSQIEILIFSMAINGFSAVLAALFIVFFFPSFIVFFFPSALLPVIGMVTLYKVKADKVDIPLFSSHAYLE